MKSVQVPAFLSDLYRDLRDRRLLLPAMALVIAILAVPVVLASSPEAAPPPPATQPSDDSAAVEPAVLAEQSGLRNYKERLGALKEQNPFDQKFAAPTAQSVAIEETVAETDTASSSVTPSGTTDPSTSVSVATGDSVAPTEPTTTEPTTPSDTNVDSEPANEPKPEVRFVVGRVDVAFGPVGDTRVFDDVRELDLIPNDKAPLASFIGLAGNGEHAVFGLTPSVVDTRGEGSCSPGASKCQFLRLGVDEVRYLKTGNDKTYKLRLLDTRLVGVQPDRGDD